MHSTVYESTFSHQHESATAGYYSVLLETTHIQVALTVTPRTGFAQVTYPPTKNALMLINTGGSATGNATMGTGVQIVGNNEVSGSATSGHFCGSNNMYTVYFVAQFDHPFSSFGTWNGDTVTSDTRSSNGSHAGAYLRFDTIQQQLIQVKVGISFVSVANARLNLEQENPDWNFERVHQAAQAAWNERLAAIEVGGGTDAHNERQVFYTALYHTLFHPNVFSDVNGQYLGFDQRVHVARGYTQYENFPGWDMYRSLVALLALLEPQATGDMMQSLVADAQQGGGGLPRWEVANDNSGGMVGDSDDALIATSYAFGVRGFDALAALHAMDMGASVASTQAGKYHTREGLDDYLKLGYVSTRISGSAAITLEYATDDFAIAQLAKALGNTTTYTTYMQRSQNWKHLFQQHDEYIEPRNFDGSFISHYSPTSEQGFVESNGLQYSWMVPYDLSGLFGAMGGDSKVIQRLDTHFTELNAGPLSAYAFMGNEPEFEVPWEYDFAGAPYRTQDVLRRIETQLFLPTPDGLPGNDDGGAMSSWYVFAALGLYPEIPGVAGFALGSPLFPSMTVHLGNGQQLHIVAPSASVSTRYVQRLDINGQPYNQAWLPFAQIEHGATLEFALGNVPNMVWGIEA
jgi:predicted alpha-1,2-mannosidase